MRRARGVALGLLSTCALAWAFGPAGSVTRPGQARRGNALGALRHGGARVVRSRRGDGRHHAVLGALRPARRAREADARQSLRPSLAESWTESADQTAYEFKLREGLKFHNGDPFTAEDVKFSFQRTKGATLLQQKVKEVVIVDPHRVRFLLHEPWPDFMTYYGTFATGAGWIVPKAYMEKVGPDGFKKHPIGLGPYKFVSSTPGIELVMEAYRGLLAQDAVGQAPGLQEHPGGDDAAGRAQARRGRPRLSARCDAGRGGQARSQAQARVLRRHRHHVSRLSRHVGSEIAVGRPARAPGRQPGARPQGDQRGRDLGRLATDRQRRARRASSSRCRSSRIPTIRRGQEAARRGRLSQRLRRRRSLSLAALFLDRRGDHQLSRRGRHQDARAHHGARRPLCRAGEQEA